MARWRLALAGVALHDQRRMVASGMAQLAWSKPKWRTFMQAIGQDMLEEPAEKLHDVEVGGA